MINLIWHQLKIAARNLLILFGSQMAVICFTSFLGMVFGGRVSIMLKALPTHLMVVWTALAVLSMVPKIKRVEFFEISKGVNWGLSGAILILGIVKSMAHLTESVEQIGGLVGSNLMFLYFALCLHLAIYLIQKFMNMNSKIIDTPVDKVATKPKKFLLFSVGFTSLLGFIVLGWIVGMMLYLVVEKQTDAYKRSTEKFKKESAVRDVVQERVATEIEDYVHKNCKQLSYEETRAIESRIEAEEFKKAGIAL